MNCITFTKNWFHFSTKFTIFRKERNNIKWYLTKYNCQHLLCELSHYMFNISTVGWHTCLQSLQWRLSIAFSGKSDQIDWTASLNCFWLRQWWVAPNLSDLNSLDYQFWKQCWSLITSSNRSQKQFKRIKIPVNQPKSINMWI